jgi:uncharacterized protein
MTRALILGIALFILLWLIRRAFTARGPGRGSSAPGAGGEAAPGSADAPAAETLTELVECAHCGVLLPQSEALLAEGRTYCSQEHMRLGAR